MSLVQLKPNEVADLFVDLCGRLRAMGATKVEAFGLSASFALPDRATPDTTPLPREPRREVEEPISTPDGLDLQKRARHFAAGGGT